MEDKLDKLIKFKHNSKQIAKQQSFLYPDKNLKCDNVLSLLRDSNDDERPTTISAGQASSGNVYHRTQQSANKSEKEETVTFDFKGKLMAVKKTKISQDAEQFLVKPNVRISVPSRKQLRDTQKSSSQVHRKESILEIYHENLNQLYEEGENKLTQQHLAESAQSRRSGSDGAKQNNQVTVSANNFISNVESSLKALKKAVKIDNQVEYETTGSLKTLSSEQSSVVKKVSTYQPRRSSIVKKSKKLVDMLDIVDEKQMIENCDYKQNEFIRGENGRVLSLVASNIKETGSAHVKHESRLFMKDPINTMKDNDVTAGLTLKTYGNSVLYKGPSIQSVSS